MKELLLLVEDDALIRQTTLDFLEVEDYQVLSAENGVEGLALARRYAPALIISDLVMPQMDGYQLLEALHQNVLTTQIPFVFLSAKAEKVAIAQALQAGAADFLVKPFNLGELLAVIEACLQKADKTPGLLTLA